MSNYSSEIDTLIRAYFRRTLAEVEQKAFEARLETDADFSSAFALEKENRAFFKVYEYYKMQEADAIIQSIEKSNPLTWNVTENSDNQANEASKKWLGLGLLLVMGLSLGLYVYYAQHTSSNTPTISAPIQAEKLSHQDTTKSAERAVNVQDTLHKTTTNPDRVPKIVPKNTAFEDSLKSYLDVEKAIKTSQNELIIFLKTNLSINHYLIDTLKALTNCEHQKNNFSLAPPKFLLLADSLVLDSIRIMQVFPPPPTSLLTLQRQRNTIQQWEKASIARKDKAYQRNQALKDQIKRYSRELKACRG